MRQVATAAFLEEDRVLVENHFYDPVCAGHRPFLYSSLPPSGANFCVLSEWDQCNDENYGQAMDDPVL